MAGWHELQLRETSRHAPVVAKSCRYASEPARWMKHTAAREPCGADLLWLRLENHPEHCQSGPREKAP